MRQVKRLSYYVIIIFGVLSLISHTYSNTKKNTEPQVLGEQSAEVSVTIGKIERYSLFGYASSLATVKLEGYGLSEQVTAQNDGYFEFINFLVQSSTKEFCLNTIDTEKLTAPPVCFPKPENVKGKKLGPFLLPPTISITEKQNANPQVGGKTIPGTQVTINLFTTETGPLGQGFVKKVHAQEKKHAQLQTTATSDGTYSSSIEAKKEGKVRLFAQSLYNQQKTPKSFTLTINVFASWYLWLISLMPLLRNLFTPLNLILLQLGLIALLIYKKHKLIPIFFHKKKRSTNIMLYEHKQLSVKEHREVELKKKNEIEKPKHNLPVRETN